jgi:hypothetical protein
MLVAGIALSGSDTNHMLVVLPGTIDASLTLEGLTAERVLIMH